MHENYFLKSFFRYSCFLFIVFFFTQANAQGTSCTTATLMTVNGPCRSGDNISDTTQDIPNTGTTCAAGTFRREGWYTFTVTSGPIDISIIGNITVTNRNLNLQLISGTCGGVLTQIACANSTNTNSAQTETINYSALPNGTYFIKVSNVGTNGNMALNSLCITSPATNTSCATATPLPCGTTNLSGSTIGTTGLTANGTGCSLSDYGVWYTFVGDGQQTTITTNPSFDIKLSVSTGTCGSLSNIVCTDSAPETATFTTVNGTTYYVYVAYWLSSGSTTGTFTISRSCTAAPTPPTNDNCSTAIPLTVSSACSYSNYSNANATSSSGVPAPGCANYSGGDVWFSAVVPATGILTVDTQTNVISDGGMAFYSGSCGSLSLLACDDDSSSNGLMPYISLSGLTPGQTIYIRFWEYGNDNNGTFGICATSPTCITPVLNTVSNITTNSATISWNAVTPTPTIGYEYVVSTSSLTPSSGTATTSTTINLTGLLSDTTYYVFVRSNCGSGDFSAWTPYTIFTTGYCHSGSTTSGYYINNFSTSGGSNNIVNNGSGYSSGGYGNFTSQSVSQINSGNVSFSVVFYDGIYTYGFNIWVDWNNDYDFNDAGELVYSSGAYVSSASGTFTIPATASIGNHRMRIVANYLSTNPSSCGSISDGETEDYTLIVLSPLPCSQNPLSISVTSTSQTTATVNWTAPTSPPTNGYQYYLSTTNSTPSASTMPTGSTLSGITTVNLTGLTSGGAYYIWVRSNCGGILGQGVWIGPTSFTQPNCALGSGTGTSSLSCPNAVAGGLGLSGADPSPINQCSGGTCVDLEATYLPIAQTTNYTVQSIPYAPPYQFNCLRNNVSINVDDVWSQTINLPFNFCYYGTNYSQCLIGSNGVITFDLTNNTPSGYNNWSFSGNLPNNTLFLNTIFGVYHDIDPSVGGKVGWELITLNSGCRALVASWSDIPMFSSTCNSQLYTGMIVLYENTNIIEVYIKEKNVCSTWNSGNAIVGIQNSTGTAAVVAPNRNGLDIDWTTSNEAWRFTPSGASIATVKWYQGNGTSGLIVGVTPTINVCPTTTTTYTAEVTYTSCSGSTIKTTDTTLVTVNNSKIWNGVIDTDWNKPNNWTPNTSIPNGNDCVIIPITANNPIVSGTNYNALAGTLTIHNGATLTVNSNNNITITNWINVQPTGTFLLNNTSNLVQINNVVNTGNITYKRDASVRKLDYVYWSSPVSGFNVSNIASPLTLGPIYTWNPTFSNPNGGQGYWINAAGNTMINAKGYIARAPSTFSTTTASTLSGSFTGIPNNGIITIPISRGTDTNTGYHTGTNGTEITNFSDNWNLVGNPYPSSIRGSQFLFNNNTKIEGSINLWTHGTLPAVISSPFYDTFVYNYTPGDYLTYNFTGTTCCPAAGSDLFIGAGQGFFVQMKDGPTATDFVTFDNSLRSASYDNSLFYRTSPPTTVNQNLIDIERHRIWLDIIDSNNSSNRALIGYIEGATMDRDSFFDSKIAAGGFMSIYSLIEDNKYNIQGRALPFDVNDEVPIGINIPNAGIYSIAIAGIDGLFGTQNIYLKDTFLNVIHDIKANPYQFTSNEGTFNQRFKIVYIPTTLGNNNNFNINNDVKVLTNTNIEIISSTENIKSIIVYDVLGRKIDEFKNINSQNFIISTLMKNNTSLFLNVTLENNSIVIKKIIH